ncbi:hypothetical protein [Calothrix sp. UHCC 0171]|nr:hypothetical protein [Calothrix sp. UHCC 0171]MEA5572688.1 hypothetical protein [Calothrix sp. UHCC 0171]
MESFDYVIFGAGYPSVLGGIDNGINVVKIMTGESVWKNHQKSQLLVANG